MPATRSNRVFRFGNVSTKSLGMIELFIQSPDQTPSISILLDVVEVDISAFIGIGAMSGNCLTVDKISKRLWYHVVISYES